MLKLHQYFFLNLLTLFIFALIFSSFVSYFAIKNIDLEHFESKLQAIAETTQIAISNDNLHKIDEIANEISLKTKARITIIDEEGEVLAESDEDKETMENHSLREEIKQARKDGYGKAVRYSKTIKADLLYVAKKVEINELNLYIRVAITTSKIRENFISMWIKITAIFTLSIFLGLLFSYSMSKKLRFEVSNIANFLDELSNKNYKPTMQKSNIMEFFQITQNLRKLAKKLDKREKQKRKYTAKLRLINKQRSDLISAISHEFKNPIAAIMGYAQTINDDKDINPTIRDKFLEKIYKNSQKISSMIDRLTMAVKFENNEINPKFASVDMANVIKESISLLNGNLANRKINLELEPFVVNADRAMMENVITNLIDNAIKYSEDDISITIKDRVISIIDKGIGISSEDIQKVKTKFYRVNEQTWDNSMGLGLALVEHILNLHNSTLEISSIKNHGSTFFFKL